MIHGNAAPYVSWDNTIDDLVGAGLRVLRYDVLGHGFSDRPSRRTYDTAQYVAQLAELIDRLGIAYPVSIVGSSQGGSIGAHFTAANPCRVDRLALLAPWPPVVAGKGSLLETIITAPLVGDLLMNLVGDGKVCDLTGRITEPEKKAALEHEVAKQLQFRGKRAAILANLRGDSVTSPAAAYAQVRAQGIPTLLIWGTRDKAVSEDSMRRLRALIPDIEYHQIDGASHLAHYEYPERVTPILVEFLTRPAAEEAPIKAAG
jgi:pimeloyl-ACP methyl ester carboxylesterase